MASIFISYRREDTGGHAGRLCDRLTARFGGDRVFMDIQDIRPGQNFAASIEETIATCDCVIAVIGPRWLETIRTRARTPGDFVRHEIAAALKRGVTVIPVLVGGAQMPAAADLPPELAALSVRNAVSIRDERFDDDVETLETFLASGLRVGGRSGQRRDAALIRSLRFAIPLVLLVAAALSGYLLLRPAARVADAPPALAAPSIDGDWVAEMQKTGQRPFRIRLHFQRLGGRITGVAQYPTGEAAMHDVVLEGRTLTFSTTHVPQFESTPATIRFQGEVTDEGIRLAATYDSGVATGLAVRPREH